MSANIETGRSRNFSIRARHEDYLAWREVAVSTGAKTFNRWVCQTLNEAVRELDKDVDQAVEEGIKEFNSYLSDPIFVNPRVYRFIPAPPSRRERLWAWLVTHLTR